MASRRIHYRIPALMLLVAWTLSSASLREAPAAAASQIISPARILHRELLLFCSTASGQSLLLAARGDGSGAHSVPSRPIAGSGGAAWSPDRRQIVFSISGASGGLFTMRADGSHVRKLAASLPNDSSPTWSPDGSSIAF